MNGASQSSTSRIVPQFGIKKRKKQQPNLETSAHTNHAKHCNSVSNDRVVPSFRKAASKKQVKLTHDSNPKIHVNNSKQCDQISSISIASTPKPPTKKQKTTNKESSTTVRTQSKGLMLAHEILAKLSSSQKDGPQQNCQGVASQPNSQTQQVIRIFLEV